MYLVIDPSIHESIKITVLYPDREKEYTYHQKNRELLAMIVTTLDREGVTRNDIQGIFVCVGVGGFSSTRIASVVTNIFGFGLGIPVRALLPGEMVSYNTILDELGAPSGFRYIMPTYSGEPNIGTSS